MIYLGIETSGAIGDICILDTDSGKQLSKELTTVHKVSEVLTTEIDSLVKEFDTTLKDIGVIIVGIGPGSYTGTRIGVATAKGLAYPFHKKLIGVSSIDGLIAGYKNSLKDKCNYKICAAIDAKNERVYHNVNQSIECDVVSNVIKNIREKTVFIGTGAGAYRELFLKNSNVIIADKWIKDINAIDLCTAAMEKSKLGEYDGIESLKPLYVNPPNIGTSKK